MEPWKGKRGRTAAGANKAVEHRRSRSAPPGKRMQELTPRERTAAGANKAAARRRSSSAPPGKRTQELTPRERRVTATLLFVWLAVADANAYIAMTEDEVEEEYRRAGKLHRYNPDNEWQKRLARLARKWPPPDGFIPEIDEYFKLLDDDDMDEVQVEVEVEGKEQISQTDTEKKS